MTPTEAAFAERWVGLLYETAKAALYTAAGRAIDDEGKPTHTTMKRAAWDLSELEREEGANLGDGFLGRITALLDPRLAAVRFAALAFAAVPSEETRAAIPAAARKHFLRQSASVGVSTGPFAHEPTRRLPASR